MIILKDGKRFEGSPNLDPGKVTQVVKAGLWDDATLAKHGLAACESFIVPEGKVTIGEPRYVESKGKWSEVYDVQDAPPPPPPLTPEQKLFEATGLTVKELKELLA